MHLHVFVDSRFSIIVMDNNYDSPNGKHIDIITPLPYIGELTNDFQKVHHNSVYSKTWGVGSYVPMLYFVRLSKVNQIPKNVCELN